MSHSEADAVRWEMMEAGGRTAQSFGLTRLFGRLYVLLYLSPESLCLSELADQLGVSKASVSIACRQLASWGAVRCVERPGDRRDYYVAETDFGKLLSGGLLASLGKKLESARTQIERSLRQLENQADAQGRATFLKRRLMEAEQRRAKVARLLKNPLLHQVL